MSEMTATRIARAATLSVAVALWLGAAWLLWRTQVPDDLRLPHVDPEQVASPAALALALVLARRFGRRWWIPAAPLLVAAALGLAWGSPLLGPKLHPLRDPALAASLRPAHVRV